MENKFGGFNHLPNPNSFQRRESYTTPNNVSQANNISNNKFSRDGMPIESLDGRKWETRDQAMVANKEYYKKLGKDINHKEENPEAFNLNNFYKFNKD